MKSLPLSATQVTGPLVLVLAATLLTLIGLQSAITDYLIYEQGQVHLGEYWRLLTCHLVHLNVSHLILNLFGVVLLWILHGDDYRLGSYLGIAFTVALAIGLGYLFFETSVWYAGLSGVLHGIFVWGVTLDFKAGRKTAWILLFGLILKLAWEAYAGGDPVMAGIIGAPIATDAHLIGSLAGGFCALVLLARDLRVKGE